MYYFFIYNKRKNKEEEKMVNYETEFQNQNEILDRLDFGMRELRKVIVMRRRRFITKKEYREKMKEIELFLEL
jgi:hypothetical protein